MNDCIIPRFLESGKKVKVNFKADWKSELDYFDFDNMIPTWTMARAMSLERWSQEYFQTLKEYDVKK